MDETTTANKTEKTKSKASSKTSKAKSPQKKTTEAKASPKKTNSKKSTTRKTVAKNAAVISIEQRHVMIEKMAYLFAEKRGFIGGDPTQDWLAAESEIDASITTGLVRSESVPH